MVLKKLAKISAPIIIDGGANVGKYALLIHKYNTTSKIYALEPVDSTFEKLKENTQHIKNIIPINKGLFSENCSKEINIFRSDTHSSIYDIDGYSTKEKNVKTIDLVAGDHFLNEHKIEQVDFLKIDIEGAEYDALLGFKESIKKGNIKAVQFEYGYINITTKKLLIDFYHFFEAHDYVIGKIFPKRVEFRAYKYKYEDFLGPNFIAVKKSETELIKVLSHN